MGYVLYVLLLVAAFFWPWLMEMLPHEAVNLLFGGAMGLLIVTMPAFILGYAVLRVLGITNFRLPELTIQSVSGRRIRDPFWSWDSALSGFFVGGLLMGLMLALFDPDFFWLSFSHGCSATIWLGCLVGGIMLLSFAAQYRRLRAIRLTVPVVQQSALRGRSSRQR
jgi:hypothetical protein